MIHAVVLPTGWEALVTWSDPVGGQPVSLDTVILTCRLETPLGTPGRVAELGASLLADAVTALEHVRNIAYGGWGAVPDGFRPDCARDVSALVRLIGKLRAPGCILVWKHDGDGAIWTTIQSGADQLVSAGKRVRRTSGRRITEVTIPPRALTPIPDAMLLSRYATIGGIAAARLRQHTQARSMFKLARQASPEVGKHWTRWAASCVAPISNRIWQPTPEYSAESSVPVLSEEASLLSSPDLFAQAASAA